MCTVLGINRDFVSLLSIMREYTSSSNFGQCDIDQEIKKENCKIMQPNGLNAKNFFITLFFGLAKYGFRTGKNRTNVTLVWEIRTKMHFSHCCATFDAPCLVYFKLSKCSFISWSSFVFTARDLTKTIFAVGKRHE